MSCFVSSFSSGFFYFEGIRSLNRGCGVFVFDLFRFSYSVGVGRIGVFITFSIVLERMRYEGVVDIF